jgi:hypothetical protein
MFGGRGSRQLGISRVYTRFIIGFIVIAIILIFVIFYFSLSKALIQVKPQITPVSSDFIADIDTDSATTSADSIKGILFETEITLSEKFAATGAKDLEGDVIGQVTVINDLGHNQPLVARTRLLTSEGILLRLKDRIDVPANGSVEADVYADDPSTFETIAPTKFTIPGLSQSSQEFVFAESKSTIASKPGSVKSVKAIDIARAKETLMQKIYDQAINDFNNEVEGTYIAIVVAKRLGEEVVDAEVDKIVDEFNVSQTMSVTVIGIEQSDITDLAAERLTQLVSSDMQLRSLDVDNLSYVVQNYDEESKTANIKIHAEGETTLKTDSEILNKNKLAGLSKRGAELYLASFDEIESVEVVLSPFWVKKVPTLPDNITIEIIE